MTNTTQHTPTDAELRAIRGVYESDFQDGSPRENNQVWDWSGDKYITGKAYSGAISSCVKKGFIGSSGGRCGGEDGTVWLTASGVEAYHSKG
jgi:hypothetical protein